MKRALFASFLISMTILAACGKSSNSNEPVSPAPAANKPLRVTVTYVEGPPEQFKIDVDDGIRIKKGLDTIKWKVKYVGPGSATAADVAIEDFKFGGESNPFGDGSAGKNRFRFDPAPGGPDREKDTEPASKAGDFKYKISVVLPNGKMIVVDPVVIIDN